MLTFDPSFFIGVFPRLISALPFTVEVIIASILLCLFFGTIIAVIRIAYGANSVSALIKAFKMFDTCVAAM